MASVSTQTIDDKRYQIYYDPESARWQGVETKGLPQPIPVPGAPKQGYSQYFDRDTWQWQFVKK